MARKLTAQEEDRVRHRLIDFYRKHSPNEMFKVDSALKMGLSEEELFKKLYEKHNLGPDGEPIKQMEMDFGAMQRVNSDLFLLPQERQQQAPPRRSGSRGNDDDRDDVPMLPLRRGSSVLRHRTDDVPEGPQTGPRHTTIALRALQAAVRMQLVAGPNKGKGRVVLHHKEDTPPPQRAPTAAPWGGGGDDFNDEFDDDVEMMTRPPPTAAVAAPQRGGSSSRLPPDPWNDPDIWGDDNDDNDEGRRMVLPKLHGQQQQYRSVAAIAAPAPSTGDNDLAAPLLSRPSAATSDTTSNNVQHHHDVKDNKSDCDGIPWKRILDWKVIVVVALLIIVIISCFESVERNHVAVLQNTIMGTLWNTDDTPTSLPRVFLPGLYFTGPQWRRIVFSTRIREVAFDNAAANEVIIGVPPAIRFRPLAAHVKLGTLVTISFSLMYHIDATRAPRLLNALGEDTAVAVHGTAMEQELLSSAATKWDYVIGVITRATVMSAVVQFSLEEILKAETRLQLRATLKAHLQVDLQPLHAIVVNTVVIREIKIPKIVAEQKKLIFVVQQEQITAAHRQEARLIRMGTAIDVLKIDTQVNITIVSSEALAARMVFEADQRRKQRITQVRSEMFHMLVAGLGWISPDDVPIGTKETLIRLLAMIDASDHSLGDTSKAANFTWIRDPEVFQFLQGPVVRMDDHP